MAESIDIFKFFKRIFYFHPEDFEYFRDEGVNDYPIAFISLAKGKIDITLV